MTFMDIDLSPFYAQPGDLPFSDRRAVMPWRNSMPIAADKIHSEWLHLTTQTLPSRKRLLYIHIPFCATHCKFCGFYQNKLTDNSTEKYLSYLLQELELEAKTTLLQSAPIHAIYFGGGTPTAMSATELHKIISTLKAKLPLAPDCEITVEGRILNFNDERIDACLEAGANRFSIGIQTFNTRIRQRLARTAGREEAIRFMENLASRDKAAVVCDLIFGLPGQTLEIWQEDLTIASQLPLDGVDLYALNLLPTTPLFKAVENKRTELPNVTLRRACYHLGAEFLAQQGWTHLSNSHWARTTRERNLYNLLIKRGADCLAMGSGAGGNLNGHSYMMERNLERYYQALDEGRKPIMMMTMPTEERHWRHKLQAGVEVARVDLSTLTPNAAHLQPLIDQWHQSGLIRDNSLCLRLTHDGRFWSSNLMQALQQLIPQLNA